MGHPQVDRSAEPIWTQEQMLGMTDIQLSLLEDAMTAMFDGMGEDEVADAEIGASASEVWATVQLAREITRRRRLDTER